MVQCEAVPSGAVVADCASSIDAVLTGSGSCAPYIQCEVVSCGGMTGTCACIYMYIYTINPL